MKKLFAVIASLIALTVTVALVAILYIVNLDPNDHKAWIAEKFQETTGRSLSLDGEISLSFYPWLGIVVNNVSIGNLRGFSDTPLLQSERAEVRVKLMPILNNEYEIDTVRLLGTRINLEVNDAGEVNWENLTTAASNEDGPGSAAESQVLNNLVLGGVDIQNASLILDDRLHDRRYEISNLTATTGELVYGQPLDLVLSLNATANRPALAAQIELKGTINYDLDNQRYDLSPLSLNSTLTGPNVPDGFAEISLSAEVSIDLKEDTLVLRDLSIDALGTQLRATVNGSNVLSDAPVYQVDVDASGDDLALLFRIMEIDDLANQIAEMNSDSFSISASLEVDVQQGDLTISTLQANLLDATITGNITARKIYSETPVIIGSLNASGSDLPTIVEVAGQIQGGSQSALAQFGRELRQAPNRDFFINTDFNVNLETGNVNISTLDAQLFGATISGNFVASNIQTESPLLRGRFNSSGPDLPLLMQIAGQLSGGGDSALSQYASQLREGVKNRAFTVNAEFDANFVDGNVDVSQLSADFLGFNLHGNLIARNLQASNGTVTGKLDLRGDNLKEVLAAIDQDNLAEIAQSIHLVMEVNGNTDNLNISPFDLNLVLSGPNIPNSPVTLALNADTRLDLENGSLSMDDFSLSGLGLNLNGNLDVSKLFDDVHYSGQITVPPFNLRRLMQQLNLELPVTMDNTVFQAMAFGASVEGSMTNLNLNSFELDLDDSQINGSFSMVDFDNPAYEFKLNINQINADRYLAPEEASNSTSPEQTELTVSYLQSLNMKGEVSIGELTLYNLNLLDINLSLNANHGEISLAPVHANLYQGSYVGDIHLRVNGDTLVASLDTTLEGINLAPLMEDFMDATYVSGTGNIQLSLTGSGTTISDIIGSLNGTGSLDLVDGVLIGVDVGSVLTQVETMIRSRRPQSVQRGEQTRFDSFSATMNIENGIVSSNDLLMASAGFRVTGRGTLVNLNDDTIAYDLLTTVDESTATREDEEYDIGGYSLPIACTGTLDSPRCLPDIEEIMRRAIVSTVQRGIGNLLNRALGIEDQPQPQQDPEEIEETQEQEEEVDPERDLINRALRSIFN